MIDAAAVALRRPNWPIAIPAGWSARSVTRRCRRRTRWSSSSAGHRPSLPPTRAPTQVARLSTTSPSSCNGACYVHRHQCRGIDLVLSVVAAALLFPVLIFIGTATRLSAARREQRFAAMRLVGATPRQISRDLRPSNRRSPRSSASRSASGCSSRCAPCSRTIPVHRRAVLHHRPVAQPARHLARRGRRPDRRGRRGTPGVAPRADLTARALRRRVTPKPPRAWRLLPLLAGLAELALFRGRRAAGVHAGGQIQAFLRGILVMHGRPGHRGAVAHHGSAHGSSPGARRDRLR